MAQHPETQIEIVSETDAICAPCPHRRGKLCETQEKITHLDSNHSKMLDVKVGDVLTWNQALTKISTRVTQDQFNQACKTCEWKSLGVCENKIFSQKK